MSVLSSLIRYDYAGFAPVRFLRSAFVMLTKLISREGSSRRLDIMSCAMVLAVFNISKYCEDGIVFEPDIETTSGAVRYVNFLRFR